MRDYSQVRRALSTRPWTFRRMQVSTVVHSGSICLSVPLSLFVIRSRERIGAKMTWDCLRFEILKFGMHMYCALIPLIFVRLIRTIN